MIIYIYDWRIMTIPLKSPPLMSPTYQPYPKGKKEAPCTRNPRGEHCIGILRRKPPSVAMLDQVTRS